MSIILGKTTIFELILIYLNRWDNFIIALGVECVFVVATIAISWDSDKNG